MWSNENGIQTKYNIQEVEQRLSNAERLSNNINKHKTLKQDFPEQSEQEITEESNHWTSSTVKEKTTHGSSILHT